MKEFTEIIGGNMISGQWELNYKLFINYMWKKLGLIFNPVDHGIEWIKSHAMMPLPLVLEDRVRIYYTTRHSDGRSRICFYDADKKDLRKILYVHREPLLEVGAPGTFDDCGTVGTFVMKDGDRVLLYYNGYNVRNTVPWSNSIGVAESLDNGKTFTKKFIGPIMDRNPVDPYFTISPAILHENGEWQMWYTSGTGWLNINGRMEPVYNIKFAHSNDGINWQRDNQVCVEQSNPEECVARASVVRDGDKLKMWFTYRGSRDFRDGKDSYRIGYAEAQAGKPANWLRDDSKSGITGTEEYDSSMQAYPAVCKINDKLYLFYSGNGFGAQGVIVAEQL